MTNKTCCGTDIDRREGGGSTRPHLAPPPIRNCYSTFNYDDCDANCCINDNEYGPASEEHGKCIPTTDGGYCSKGDSNLGYYYLGGNPDKGEPGRRVPITAMQIRNRQFTEKYDSDIHKYDLNPIMKSENTRSESDILSQRNWPNYHRDRPVNKKVYIDITDDDDDDDLLLFIILFIISFILCILFTILNYKFFGKTKKYISILFFVSFIISFVLFWFSLFQLRDIHLNRNKNTTKTNRQLIYWSYIIFGFIVTLLFIILFILTIKNYFSKNRVPVTDHKNRASVHHKNKNLV
tara:strand:- start:1496 stop:2374 length:879 start_codon:yes stop_codon:yes gene_type:complete